MCFNKLAETKSALLLLIARLGIMEIGGDQGLHTYVLKKQEVITVADGTVGGGVGGGTGELSCGHAIQ
jgi:hypothetical protein